MRRKYGEKIRNLLRSVYTALKQEEEPEFIIPKRTFSSVYFDEADGYIKLKGETIRRRMLDLGESRRFMQTVLVLSTILQAIEEDDYPTIRDIYYSVKHTIEYQTPRGKRREDTFESQRESDLIIEDIEVMLGILREELGIMFDAKGRAVGKITIQSKGHKIHLDRMGVGAWAIPPSVSDVEILDVDAEYVLVVEKGAIFERLNNEEFWKKHRCILVTGKGQPDRGTRRFVKRLNEEFGLPVYVLADADPFGYYIYSVYKHGSIKLAYESERLAVPKARFLGVTTSDIYRYKIPKRYIIKATEHDLKRARELMKYPWFQKKQWRKEFELFLKKQEKVEIEALSGFGFRYLSEQYIPAKLQTGGLD